MPNEQGDITGTFRLTGYTETANFKELIEFSAELHSNGEYLMAADTP